MSIGEIISELTTANKKKPKGERRSRDQIIRIAYEVKKRGK